MQKIKEETKERKFVSLTNENLFLECFCNPRNMKHLEDLIESYFNYPRGYLRGKVTYKYTGVLPKFGLSDISIKDNLVVEVDNKLMVDLRIYKKFDEKALRKSELCAMKIYSSQPDIGVSIGDMIGVNQINFADEVQINLENKLLQRTMEFIHVKADLARLDIARNMDNSKGDRFIRHLKFLGAKTLEERASIAKCDELLMELNEWLDRYTNDETIADGFDDRKWNQYIYYNRGKKDAIEKMKNKGLDNLFVEDCTGFNLKGIEKLKEEVPKD